MRSSHSQQEAGDCFRLGKTEHRQEKEGLTLLAHDASALDFAAGISKRRP
jgi:hypothetical protein